jgi:pyridinium-3,5-bisthiocarboxylic acid mononucleotide nickel chelatase
LTTPTGAAIVAALVDDFGPLPAMAIEKIGYGAGQKDFPQANLLRLIVGQTLGTAATDSIVLLETNLDDMPGEAVAYCAEQLAKAGALDVSTTPVTMKKGRPGVLLAVQCRPADAEKLAEIVFRETTALGLRRSTVVRQTLPRRSVTIATPYGDVPGVVATLPNGGERFSAEYEACAAAARQSGASLADIDAAVRQAYRASQAR